MSLRLETVAMALGIVFLLVLPVPHTITIRLACLFLMAIASIILVRRDGALALPLKSVFVLWITMAVISLYSAVDVRYSVNEIKSEILYSFIAYFAFYALTRTAREWNGFLTAATVVLFVLSITNIWLWYTTGDAASPRFFYNGVGAYTSLLVTVFPFAFLRLVTVPARGWPYALLLVVPILLLFPAYLTANRTVWLVFAAMAITLALLLAASAKTRTFKRRAISALALVFVVSLVLFYMSLARRADMTGDPRILLWEFTVNQIALNPWSGFGFGQDSFQIAFPQWIERGALHAHNVFLDAGIQMGLPGMAVMMLVFVAVLLQYWRLYRNGVQQVRWIGACGIAMVVAVVTRNMTDEFFRRDLALLFWSIVGASLGYGRRLLVAESSGANQSAKFTTHSVSR